VSVLVCIYCGRRWRCQCEGPCVGKLIEIEMVPGCLTVYNEVEAEFLRPRATLRPAQIWTCTKCGYYNIAMIVGESRILVCEECHTIHDLVEPPTRPTGSTQV